MYERFKKVQSLVALDFQTHNWYKRVWKPQLIIIFNQKLLDNRNKIITADVVSTRNIYQIII